MYKILFLIIIIYSETISQTEVIIPSFKPDGVISYDTLFNKSNTPISSPTNTQQIIFDEEKIKLQLDSLNQSTPLNLIYNKVVGQHIKFYLFQREDQVRKLLSLAKYYFPIFEEYLDKNQLPLELKYLPIIESSLNPNARSYAGAVGLWQFMYLTAKEYDLRINSYLDERKDIYKSTQAACSYLKKAYAVFSNWDLALSSYNAGRRNITKAIRRSGGKLNYWEIRPFLPEETRNYIPAFIAAVYVMNYAGDYGINPDPNYLFETHQVDSVYLDRPIKIAHLAKLLQIDIVLLENLNPTYRLSFVPHLKNEKFSIILPNNKAGLFLINEDSIYAKLEEMELAEQLEYPLFSDIEKIKHKVKRGDFLGKIANQYNCKIKDIMLWNDLKTDQIKVGQRLNIYRTVK